MSTFTDYQHTYVDYEQLLLSAGLDKIKKVGNLGEYKFCCPYHFDKSPSAQFNVNKGVFRCFGCGHTAGYIAFFKHLGILAPTSFQEIKFTKEPKVFSSYEAFMSDYTNSIDLGAYVFSSARPIEDFPEVVAYLNARLYHPALDGFRLPIPAAYSPSRNSIVFKGQFNFVEKFLLGRYVNYGDPAHIFTDTASAVGRPFIAVEGVFDWLVIRQLEYAGYDLCGGSLLGTSITDVKIADFYRLDPAEIALAFDKDAAGFDGFKKAWPVLVNHHPKVTAVPWHKTLKDFGDMCYDDILTLLSWRTPVLNSYQNVNYEY